MADKPDRTSVQCSWDEALRDSAEVETAYNELAWYAARPGWRTKGVPEMPAIMRDGGDWPDVT